MPAKIFVSYRRDDDPNAAARVRDGLAGQYGQANVFMDVDNLLAGQRFDIKLAEALAACDLLIAVIGPRWMDLLRAKLDSGDRDYVREEIAAAMKRGIVVIPVRVGREGTMPKMSRPDELPEDIREFVLHQKHDVAYERFGRDIAELNEAILELRKETAGGDKQPVKSAPWGKVAAAVAGFALLAGAGGYAVGLFGKADAPPVQAVASSKSAEAERKRVADLQAEIERRDAALAKEQSERQRIEAEAAKLRADADARRKADDDARAKAAAEAARREQEARAKAAAEAEAKRKSDASERQRAATATGAKTASSEPVIRGPSLIDGLYKPPPDSAAGLKPGQSFRDCPECPEMVVVPPGSFMMGSPASEAGRDKDEGPQRNVTIARAFAVGKFEVTFAEWESCLAGGGCRSMRSPSDQGWGRGRRPVINVSWDDAQEFVAWLSHTTGKRYRLLSEAEWEYAARAGMATRYSWGNSDRQACEFANLADRALAETRKTKTAELKTADCRDGYVNTAPVGSFKPNNFGLHDMHGNVAEWVEDCWHDTYDGLPDDGSPWTSDCNGDNRRAERGGAWVSSSVTVRSANRNWSPPGDRLTYRGFRVARTLVP